MKVASIYEMIMKLQEFWIQKGATPIFSHHMYVGAGTFHPKCFFSSLDNKKSAYTYVQKSTRKADARYGESPNRMLHHHQLQIIFTPSPNNIKDLLIESLEFIGLSKDKNLIIFNDNNWENISIGAIGVGWEILCNNTEIGQFTYFQKMADIEPKFHTVELAMGIERLAFALWGKNVYEIPWFNDVLYKDEFFEIEKQFSIYFLEKNKDHHGEIFNIQDEILKLLDDGLYLPAYELLLKIIDIFNNLDAMKKISIIQRKEYISMTRDLAKKIANCYIDLKPL